MHPASFGGLNVFDFWHLESSSSPEARLLRVLISFGVKVAPIVTRVEDVVWGPPVTAEGGDGILD